MADRPVRRVLLALAAGVLVCGALYMTLDVRGAWSFALQFRAQKLAAMVLVAYAVAVSTVLFQTATANRILTPAIMGFDSLYVLIQTLGLFFLGSGTVAAIDRRLVFVGEVGSMVGFSVLLYWRLFLSARRSLHLLVLTGVVVGVLFRSLSTLLQRLIDPSEFAILQDRLFATFNAPDRTLLVAAGLALLAASALGWRRCACWDVVALGREAAINLGIEYRREVMRILVIAAVLVAVSTALVGPITFFGLLVANLAYLLVPSHRHVHLLPAAVLLAAICLLGGQTLLEHVFAFDANLRVIIDFLGGFTFLVLLLQGGVR